MPEGVILQEPSRRSAALIIDMTLLSAILTIVTRGRIVNIWNFELLFQSKFLLLDCDGSNSDRFYMAIFSFDRSGILEIPRPKDVLPGNSG